MNKNITANVKELSYVIRTTFGAPLDVRFLVSSLSKLAEELPKSLRYEGLIIYIQDISYFFYFHNGIEDLNCVPYNNIDIITLDTIDKAVTIPLSVRYRGMCVWVTSTNQMYIFDTGTSDADLHPHNQVDIKTIKTLDDISSIPMNARFIGQPVWIQSLQRMYVFKTGIEDNNLEPNYKTDILYLLNYADVTTVQSENRFVGQIVWVDAEQMYYSFQGGVEDSNLVPLRSQNVISIDSISHVANIPVHSRFEGQFVYAKDVNMIYVFVGGTNDNDLKPVRQTDIKYIETSIQVSQIPVSSRFVGQLVWVASTGKFWVFKNGTKDSDFVPYNQTDIVSVDTYLGEYGVQSIPTEQRFIGQLIYVKDEKRFYTFSGGTNNNNIISVLDYSVAVIPSYDELAEDILPSRARFIGQLVFAEQERMFYTFKNDINILVPFTSSNVVLISTLSNLDTELPMSSRFVGQLVYVQDMRFMGIFGNNTSTLEPLVSGSDIIKIDNIDNIKDIPSIKRFEGQLVYVKSLGSYYTFRDGVEDSNCVPLNQFDIIELETISVSLDTAIPKQLRFVGQLVYAKDEDSYYYFRGGVENVNLIKLNQFDIRSIATWTDVQTIKQSQRFEGSLIYVRDTKTYFSFVGGIDDVNLIPLQSSNIIPVQNYSDIKNITLERRYVGQMYYVRSLGMLFGYKTSTADSDLEPINAHDILTVNDTSVLNDTPIEKRYAGQLAYIRNIKTLYQCVVNNTTQTLEYVPFNQLDIISVVNRTDTDSIVTNKKFPGQLVYVQSENAYYTFNDSGIAVPMMSSSMRIVQNWDEALEIPSSLRFVGQQVYVILEHRLYTFKNTTYDSGLVPTENAFWCSSLDNLDTEIPMHARQKGQTVWIADIQQLRIFTENGSTLHIRDEIQAIQNTALLETLKNEERRPYIVLDTERKTTLVWRDHSKRYVNIISDAITSGDTVESLLASLSKDVYDEERVVGRLYFVKSLGVHYTFVDGIDDVNFKPIESNYVVQSIVDIETAIPPERRYVGMQFYVVDEALWYYFQDENTYKKQQGFTQFTDKLYIDGDFEYAHNKNVNAILLEVRNEDNEVIELPYRMGYMNESGKTDLEKAYGRRNLITLSTDIPGMYTLYMLAL